MYSINIYWKKLQEVVGHLRATRSLGCYIYEGENGRYERVVKSSVANLGCDGSCIAKSLLD